MAVKLFIVWIPRNMDKLALIELFLYHGGVRVATIITEKGTQESRGFGFITMDDELGARRAIKALNGSMIENRTISVRVATHKKDGESTTIDGRGCEQAYDEQEPKKYARKR